MNYLPKHTWKQNHTWKCLKRVCEFEKQVGRHLVPRAGSCLDSRGGSVNF